LVQGSRLQENRPALPTGASIRRSSFAVDESLISVETFPHRGLDRAGDIARLSCSFLSSGADPRLMSA
jgi:hypothetical protein